MEKQPDHLEDAKERDMKISVEGKIAKTEDDDPATWSGENDDSLSSEGKLWPRGRSQKDRFYRNSKGKLVYRKISQIEHKRKKKEKEERRLAAARDKDKAAEHRSKPLGRLLQNAKLDREGRFHFDPKR